MEPRVALHWLIGMYQAYPKDKGTFFKPFFDKLAGTTLLREQITQGMDEEHIRASWKPGLDAFRKVRVKYLLYDDFL
jgi:uncharacterized protein YbbC (DUF1343 family)